MLIFITSKEESWCIEPNKSLVERFCVEDSFTSGSCMYVYGIIVIEWLINSPVNKLL